MEYKHLGRSGVKVSQLCLGTMNFGPYTTEEDSHKIMNKALELGINFFDTANVYGWDKGRGLTEEIMGRWLKSEGKRDEVFLATKVYGNMSDRVNDGKLSAYHIKRACEASLKRLQTDHIDLYQMHHIDRETPWEEVWQAMEQLIREGKITYVGSSNFAAWNIAESFFTAKENRLLGCISEQSIYSLRNRNIELEVIPACERFGLGLIPWSPLAGGILCGVLEKATEGRRTREPLQKSAEKLRPQIEKYEALCKEIGHSPADVALAWVLKNPVVSSPIVGPRTIEQLEQNVKAIEVKLDQETLNKLDEIWPGPGNQAPEAYAW
ncbi:MAG: aldo/keto reductase [Melioribacteraceae bacterium]|nr:aldo/keto reductase [Melioribacteraceae bacterium]MCF8264416.1 aldo/keto reductase [Melioribacteraceae bacterium]MCF8414422.1 aldo/keto reductase [Melioribacteraceae bacterium]MCF8432470.1 aldo/keto reductase [Melioribacteraceae bacterium]